MFFVGQLGFLSLYGKFSFRSSRLINFGASLIFVTHLLRLFKIPFESVYWRTYKFHFDWNATSNTTLQHDCRQFSSILFLILEVFTYIDSLRVEYHLLSVVIIVKMFANVFSYDQITKFSEGNFQETFIDTETATEDTDSSVMRTRQTSTFDVIKSGIVYTTVLALLLFGKCKIKSHFHESFIKKCHQADIRKYLYALLLVQLLLKHLVE